MAWRNFDFLGSMKKVLQCPVGFDTDVNGSVGGKCPYHKNCLEGLAAGPAIEGRYGKKVTEYLGGYVNTEELSDMEHYIVPASLHDDQGSMGCLELGRKALED